MRYFIYKQPTHCMLDITGPDGPVEIKISHDKSVLWINVEGVCVLRICRITGQIILDELPDDPEITPDNSDLFTF